jgi:hypothetical protein
MALGIGISGPRGGGGGATPSLSIEVFSDAGYTIPIASLAYGATAYIKLTPTGMTPTSYSFFFGNGTKNAPQVTQVGDSLAWVVSLTGTITISATATDGTDATADATPFTLTSTLVIANSLKFDGVNDYVVGKPLIQNNQDFSITFWFKLNSTASFESMVSFYNYSSVNASVGIAFYNGGISYLSHGTGWNFNRTIAWTPDLLWHHLTFTYNTSTGAKQILIDGVSLGTLQTDFIIGAFDWFSMGFGFQKNQWGNLNMTDVAFHNGILTPSEIAAMQTLGVASGNEVQRYPFTEAAGTVTGNVNDTVANQQATLRNMLAPNGIVTDAP